MSVAQKLLWRSGEACYSKTKPGSQRDEQRYETFRPKGPAMSWCALADAQGHALSRAMARLAPEALWPSGTLMLEARLSPHDRPKPLLALTLPGGAPFDLALQAMPTGGIHFFLQQAGHHQHAALSPTASDPSDILRISYAWNVAQGYAHLVVEMPGTPHIWRHVFPAANPIPQAALRSLMCPTSHRFVGDEVIFMALSDRVEPVGPLPTLCPRTPIMTPFGEKPAGALKRGDLVTTLAGDSVPVIHSLRHTLPARGSFQPVRLRAPYFGLTHDIVVTPEARLLVGGTQVEYLFGAENVLVPVKHLMSNASAHPEAGHQLVTFVQLLLPDHEAIMVNGTALESLGIGRMRRKKDLLRHTLLGQFDPQSLPEHSKTTYAILKHFEAVTLAQHRAA
ncbi:Hint domain-containing protein [Cognatishimia sp. SS12]|uniref:Hint domain-containing protein n=1 Tax=Cognatishimia sp. SS12 TaxID=2979465 RepID=UPI00232EA5AE|nr:Hint domain-containing protein [Cognatishimia sp. SS12]MDC0737625.1 Hint domain-containing protein [Cognatishimia sp. SS12]